MMKKKSANDYKFIRLLGEGSFSSVYLAVDADAKPSVGKVRKYAIKVCLKRHIKRQSKQEAIMREKNILNVLNQNPNSHFIKLYCTFQDTDRLYFVMSYADNGDLLTYMEKHPLSLNTARNYTIQLVEALEHIHRLGIVHRDLKPENILLDNHLNLLLSDFGSAQIYPDADDNPENSLSQVNRRNSFVGTAQYVSPEMLKNREATNKSDLWALGVIIFQLITNVMPFNAPNEYLIYQKIQKLEYQFPGDIDPQARDLIKSLIQLQPFDRLGSKDDIKRTGYLSIREHDFIKCPVDQPETNGQEEINGSLNGSTQPCTDDETEDKDLVNIDQIKPGLDELEVLRILTIG